MFLYPAPHLCLEIPISSSRTSHRDTATSERGSQPLCSAAATSAWPPGWSRLRMGQWPTSGACQALGLGVASKLWLRFAAGSCLGFRGGWAAEVTAAPHPLPASHGCFLLRLPAGTQPSPATPTGAGSWSPLPLPQGLEGPSPVTLAAGTLDLSDCPVGHRPSRRGWTERSWLPAGGLGVTRGGQWPS